jgi:DNA-binding transcriptional MocR family regulator
VVPLFLDTAYEDLVHDPSTERPVSGFAWDDEGVVYELGTLSKIIAPGLRIGYMAGRDGPFLQAMVQRASDVGFSAPLVNQEIASWLLDNAAGRLVREVNLGYRAKALAMKEAIDAHLGPYLEECRGGQAGFYYYLTFREVRTGESSPFCRVLARVSGDHAVDGPRGGEKPRVLYIPGSFCVHLRGSSVEKGSRSLRLSYGYEEIPRLAEAVRLIGEAAALDSAADRG